MKLPPPLILPVLILWLLIPALMLIGTWNLAAPAAWCWLPRHLGGLLGLAGTGLAMLVGYADRNAQKATSCAEGPRV